MLNFSIKLMKNWSFLIQWKPDKQFGKMKVYYQSIFHNHVGFFSIYFMYVFRVNTIHSHQVSGTLKFQSPKGEKQNIVPERHDKTKEKTCTDPSKLSESKHLRNNSVTHHLPSAPLMYYEEFKCEYNTGSQISTMESWLVKIFIEDYRPSPVGLIRWRKWHSNGRNKASEQGFKA